VQLQLLNNPKVKSSVAESKVFPFPGHHDISCSAFMITTTDEVEHLERKHSKVQPI